MRSRCDNMARLSVFPAKCSSYVNTRPASMVPVRPPVVLLPMLTLPQACLVLTQTSLSCHSMLTRSRVPLMQQLLPAACPWMHQPGRHHISLAAAAAASACGSHQAKLQERLGHQVLHFPPPPLGP